MNALGIINFEDNTAVITGLDEARPVPAIAFLGRYRIIDFVLSNMTNSGIDNVQVYCKEKPRNLIEHLGSGTHYNINSKRGSLRVLYGEKTFSSPVYNHDIANFNLNMEYIEEDANKYVVVAPSYFLYSLDYSQVLKAHEESGADITIVYTKRNDADKSFLGCDHLGLDENGVINDINMNRGQKAEANISLECYVMEKKLFISLVKETERVSSLYWFKDILREKIKTKETEGKLCVKGYEIKGFVACINSLPEYYKASMALRDRSTAANLFKAGWPVYTQTNDSSPTTYAPGSKVTGSVVANGSVIEGTVENSIVSRGVTVKKGAVVKNSILLPGATVCENVNLDHVIVDKYATIQHKKDLKGTDDAPVYVKRRDNI
jgi:glucose-1-phosphate adenylyltransferase